MYDLITVPLQFFYQLIPNYAIAISLLTLTIMILLLPLTLKGTRSMIAMQKLQPEMKKIQAKYKDDRQKLNEEMMLFYKENNINPLSGCLPLLIQMPVFVILYRTLFELLNRQPFGYDMGAASVRAVTGVNGGGGDGIWERFGYFVPKHLDYTSQMYLDLSNTRTAESFGLNLAESASKALQSGVVHALPYIFLVVTVTATSYIQQKQVSGRNPQAQINPQQQMLMRIMPLFFAFISFTLPSGIVIYFLVSNLFRVGQQALITRTMYREDNEVLSTTGKASDKSSKDEAVKPKGFFQQLKEIEPPNPNRAKREVQASKAKRAGGGTTTATADPPASSSSSKSNGSKATSGGGGASKPSRTAPSAANRSKSKKKRK